MPTSEQLEQQYMLQQQRRSMDGSNKAQRFNNILQQIVLNQKQQESED